MKSATQATIETVEDYCRQIEDHATQLARVAGDLGRTMKRLPVADVLSAAELERRTKELEKREREMREKFRKAEAMMRGDAA